MTLVIQIWFVVAPSLVAKHVEFLDCDGAIDATARECAGIMPILLGGKRVQDAEYETPSNGMTAQGTRDIWRAASSLCRAEKLIVL
jgi:hypothetical protein